jgi:hypothetical protein
MINFKQIALSDKARIDMCLNGNIFRACDFCFANMFAWNAKFGTQYDIYRRTLFLRFKESDGFWYYMMPIGNMPVKDAIDMMKADAEERGIPFRMKGISLKMWNIIQEVMPGEFEYIHDRNNDEYLYLSNKLITLSGKKLQSKRNHINRFKQDNPNWEYFPLTTRSELDECAAMLDEWENLREDEKSLRYDYIATCLMLKHFDYLQLKGGAIRVNGKIVAFTIGEKLTDDSFVIHVEKAFSDVNGAYAIINQQFVENEASEFTYINREEDMGIDNLRKAKLSYHPDELLEEAILLPVNK